MDVASNRIARETERPKQDAEGGLLSEAGKAELSNDPSEARRLSFTIASCACAASSIP